jgi:adenylylsulfate kinase
VLVVATVVETVDDLRRSTAALASRRLLHVRLTATPEAVLSRLTKRHGDDEAALHWHIQRHPELAGILDRAGFTEELRIDTTHKQATEVVQEILTTVVE